ncbi:hypothetical protein AGMMS49982_20910 [Bacteroidia bacterium]|nr:hypothetical protein AGMMS49982_20910 [Bacteroidia bacterium]
MVETDKFKLVKKYKNGGQVLVHPEVDKKLHDYKDILTIANHFATLGELVRITPKLYFDKRGINDSSRYKDVYRGLLGTAYEGKCPDLMIGELFYEYESYVAPFKKSKISDMLSHGFKQSSRIIINNTNGAKDNFIERNVRRRMEDKNFKNAIDEVWLYEKGKIRMLLKIQQGAKKPPLQAHDPKNS